MLSQRGLQQTDDGASQQSLASLPGPQWSSRPQGHATAQTLPPSRQQGALTLGQSHSKHASCANVLQGRTSLLGPGPQGQAHSMLKASGSSPTTSGSLPDGSQTLPTYRGKHLLRKHGTGRRAERNRGTPEYNVRTSPAPSPGGTSCRSEMNPNMPGHAHRPVKFLHLQGRTQGATLSSRVRKLTKQQERNSRPTVETQSVPQNLRSLD